MRTVFADTSYFIALLCRDDQNHGRAMRLSRERMRLITTEWVLSELAAYLSDPPDRGLFLQTLEVLENSAAAEIIPASHEWFQAATHLYAERDDKQWSLVDCISFGLMAERDVQEALTADHHFEQAGFVALLK